MSKKGSRKQKSITEDPSGNRRGSTSNTQPLSYIPLSKSPIETQIKPRKGPAPAPPVDQKKLRCQENIIYCLFIGQAGCGKSKSINFFFGDKEVSPIERETGTEEILELSAVLSKSKNEKIVIIDTPGLGDMNSLDWDGRVIKSIETFLKEHEQLKNCLPNAVLLFGRFDDNRMDGESSNFVKMLKAVYSVQSSLIDPTGNNLIIVLTHYMNGKKAMRQDPTPKIQLVVNLVKIHLKLTITPRVVLAENEAIDWQLEQRDEGSYLLKNNEGNIYPNNMYESILEVCEMSKDTTGSKLITKAWDFRHKIASKFESNSHPMVSELDSEIATAKLAHIYNTNVSQLRDTMNLRWNNKLGRSIEDPEFQTLLDKLEKKNILDPRDLQKNPEEWIVFLQSLSIMDVALIQLLESVGCSTKNYDVTQSIGSGWYTPFNAFAKSNPVRFGTLSFQASILPHRLPVNVSCALLSELGTKQPNNTQGFKRFTKTNRGRATSTGDKKLSVKYRPASHSEIEMYSESQVFGQSECQVFSQSESQVFDPSENQVSGHSESQGSGQSEGQIPGHSEGQVYANCKEIPVAKLKISCDVENLPMDPNFKRAAQQLKPFVKSERLSIKQWREFFDKWGSHIVTSAYVGGSYTTKVSRKDYLKLRRATNVGKFEALLDSLVEFDRGFKIKCKESFQYQIVFSGGKQMETMEIVYPPSEEQINNFKEWRNTIRMNPICLKDAIGLTPINKLTPELQEPSLNFDEAFNTLITVPDRNEKSGTVTLANRLANMKFFSIFKKKP